MAGGASFATLKLALASFAFLKIKSRGQADLALKLLTTPKSIIGKGKVKRGPNWFDHYVCVCGYNHAICDNLGNFVFFDGADAKDETTAAALWRALNFRVEVAYALYQPSGGHPAKKSRTV